MSDMWGKWQSAVDAAAEYRELVDIPMATRNVPNMCRNWLGDESFQLGQCMTATTMAVLCGGKGTRLGELTKNTPKSLIEVAGRPFLEWPLEHYASQGIQRVVLCIGHLGEQIQAHFGTSFAGMALEYLKDEPQRGPINAWMNFADLYPVPFWWTYGDTYLPIDLREPAQSASYRIDNDGWAVGHPKGWIDYGLYYEANRIAHTLRVRVPQEQRFYEIGTPAALAETKDYFARKLSPQSVGSAY